MKIRSITLGTTLEGGLESSLQRAGQVLAVAGDRFGAAGYEVQTTRVSLPPLARLGGLQSDLPALAERIEQTLGAAGVGYVALGPVRWADGAEQARRLASELAPALAAHDRVFGSIETADAGGVRFEAIQASANAVRALAGLTAEGFGNLRFAALAGCPPGIPFFPAAYHESGQPSFSLALQAADLAVGAFGAATTLAGAAANLTAAMDDALAGLERVALGLEAELGVRYGGADPTLAPFPSDQESIGAAFERLGVGRFGVAGTLTAAALVTRALRAVHGRRCGFSGVMLPVLEDSVLALRAAEGQYSWEELLLYSSVCGTGLDTVPLPGDIGADELAAMILDVSTLAVALGKPLTCRLFPVPGRVTGEPTSFDFPFFANGGVLRTKGLGSPLLVRRGLADRSP